MNGVIKNIFNLGIQNYIAFATILVNLIITYLNNKNKINIEKIKNNEAHSIQIQEYFKKLGTQKQSEILSEWAYLVSDLNVYKSTFKDAKKIQKMKHDVVMYGSQTTIKIMASFMHFAYENGKNVNPYKGLVYATFIITSLKNDFSGYLPDPVDFLKLQLTDFSEYKDKFMPYFNEIRRENGLNW